MNKEVKELIDTLKEYANGFISVLAPTEESVKVLLDYINQLETNRDEAIRYIKAYMPSFQNYIASDTEFNAKELLEILERGKE